MLCLCFFSQRGVNNYLLKKAAIMLSGVLGDLVSVAKDRTKITVTSDIPMSKR